MFHLLTAEIVVKIYNFPITAHLPPIFCVLVFDYVKLRPPPTTPPLETSKFIVDFRFDHPKYKGMYEITDQKEFVKTENKQISARD